MQDKEIHNVLKKAKKAATFAAKENAKCNATFDLVRKFESQVLLHKRMDKLSCTKLICKFLKLQYCRI